MTGILIMLFVIIVQLSVIIVFLGVTAANTGRRR